MTLKIVASVYQDKDVCKFLGGVQFQIKKTKSILPNPFEKCVTGITASHRAESIYIDGAELSEFI